MKIKFTKRFARLFTVADFICRQNARFKIPINSPKLDNILDIAYQVSECEKDEACRQLLKNDMINKYFDYANRK